MLLVASLLIFSIGYAIGVMVATERTRGVFEVELEGMIEKLAELNDRVSREL